MSDEKYDFDYEQGMIRPALWRKTKELWQCAQHATTRIIFRRLEKLSGKCTARWNFLVALHHFSTLTPEQRFAATMKYHHWSSMIVGRCGEHHASYGTPLREAPACECIPATGEKIDDGTDFGEFQVRSVPGTGMCYFCGFCGKQYMMGHAMVAHLSRVHGVTLGPKPRTVERVADPAHCSYCGMSFPTAADLDAHVRGHHFNGDQANDQEEGEGEGWKGAA